MLAKEFVWLVLIAFLVAAPIAWLVMHKWLINYTYRIPIGWDIFALSAGLTLLIVIATVSYQAVRAAIAICGMLGSGIGNTILALTVTFIPPIVRISETVTAQIRSFEFVEAARVSRRCTTT